MSLAIHELKSSPVIRPADVDAFLAERGVPIVEGRTVTFVYRGLADEVYLQHWIHGLSSNSEPFTRLPGTDLWFLVMDLPRGSRVEYKLGVTHHGHRQLINDPLNPNRATDPFGSNSVVHADGYEVPAWTAEDPEARRGTIETLRINSAALADDREFQVYLPARFRKSRRYPLLVVHDGPEYLQFAGMETVLNNLIHRLEIPPMIVAFTGSPRRLVEYAADEAHSRFLVDELVPMLEERYPLLATPATRGLMGSSFGAVATLSTAWRHPDVFGNLLVQSGSFAFTDIGEHDRGPTFDPVVEFVNAFRKQPGRPANRIFVSCGTYESMIYFNRSMVPTLQSTGMSVRYAEARDGHNWENWRDRLREALSWLFPGPLWMVYE